MDGFSLRALLRLALKSDEIIALLERYDMEVIYTFDRLHDGSEDSYWTGTRAGGFQLRFDQQQRLDTIFCYVKEKDGFSAIDTVLTGVPVFRTFAEARQTVAEQGLSFLTPDSSQEFYQRWLRVDLPRESVHYEFSNGQLELITLITTVP